MELEGFAHYVTLRRSKNLLQISLKLTSVLKVKFGRYVMSKLREILHIFKSIKTCSCICSFLIPH